LSSYEAKGRWIAQKENRNFKENSVMGFGGSDDLETWFARTLSERGWLIWWFICDFKNKFEKK